MTEWSEDIILYRVERTHETLEDARILANSERWNACINRLYYACFYAVSALLMKNGLSSSKHSGVRSLFNFNFVKTGKVPKDLARISNDHVWNEEDVIAVYRGRKIIKGIEKLMIWEWH